MPQTVPDGFEFERPTGDEPGRTLTGGQAGLSPILAEQVQAKVSDTDATLAALASRVAALEDGTGGVGWMPIAAGQNNGATFSIDLTAGGKYPTPPRWDTVKVHMRYHLTAVQRVLLRINGDSDSVYRSGWTALDAEGNIDVPESGFEATGTSWSIGWGSTFSTNNLEFTLFHAFADPGLVNFQCTSVRQSTNATSHRYTVASGALASGGKTPNSLQFLVTGGASFNQSWWSAQGLRMVHPS
jgi:hypothetical protein